MDSNLLSEALVIALSLIMIIICQLYLFRIKKQRTAKKNCALPQSSKTPKA